MKNSRTLWGMARLPGTTLAVAFALVLAVAILFGGCTDEEPTGACIKKDWDPLTSTWIYTCLGNMTYDGCQDNYKQWGEVIGWEEGQTCWEACSWCDNIFED